MSNKKLLALCPHPAQPPAIAMQIKAGVVLQSDDALVISFQCCYPHASSDTQILLPAPTEPIACDNLWQHTCCEAFVSAPDGDGSDNDGDGYLEFNFSPSGCWAVYRFDAYRVRDASFVCPFVPQIEFRSNADGFELIATISPKVLPKANSWLVGLTAVIETTDAHKSYWALRHDAAAPDFHLKSQFLLTLRR